MRNVVKTYQQNFISDVGVKWNFTFASIPHKFKPSNRFKVSVSNIALFSSISWADNGDDGLVFTPTRIIWLKGLGKSISHTITNTGATNENTILGVIGNNIDKVPEGAGVTLVNESYSVDYTQYYFYLDEMPTNVLEVYLTQMEQPPMVYNENIEPAKVVISFLIEEEETV
jgi:hypothetical protein